MTCSRCGGYGMLKVITELENPTATARLETCKVCEGYGWVKFGIRGPCFVSQSIMPLLLTLDDELLW